MSNEEYDVDKELERLSRKTDVNILKTEMKFENRLKQLDKDINKTIKSKEEIFDETKELTSKHLTSEYKGSSMDMYRERLKRI